MDFDKIKKMYIENKIITCCAESFRKFTAGESKTLDVLIDGEWQRIVPPVKEYQNYSHSLHPDIIKKYYPRIYEKMNNKKG